MVPTEGVKVALGIAQERGSPWLVSINIQHFPRVLEASDFQSSKPVSHIIDPALIVFSLFHCYFPPPPPPHKESISSQALWECDFLL